jgi:hypothetical protein
MRGAMHHVTAWACAWCVLLGGSGCSFITVRSPTAAGPDDVPVDLQCTDSKFAPIVDTTLASVYVLMAVTIGVAATTKHAWGSACSEYACGLTPLFLASAAAGGIYAGSAVHGFGATERCRAQLDRGCARGDQPACLRLGMSPPKGQVNSVPQALDDALRAADPHSAAESPRRER